MARAVVQADGATIVLKEGRVCSYVDEHAIGPLWKGRRFPMDDCISGWVMDHRAPAVVPDITTDDRIPLAAYEPTFVRSLAMVPIRSDDPIGAIGVYWSREHRASDGEVAAVQVLADFAATAIERLVQQAELERRVDERTRELHAQVEQLMQVQEERWALVAEATNAEERERERVSELLHDDALQFVLAAQQELQEARKGAADALDLAEQHLRDASRRLRDLVTDLSPLTFHQSRLDEAVRSIVATQGRRAGWRVDLDLEQGLTTPFVHLVLRAAREALVNVRRHANARSVAVRLARDGAELVLEVRDDGEGIRPELVLGAAHLGHIGIASLRARAAAVGGAFSLAPVAGGGTLVELRVPAG